MFVDYDPTFNKYCVYNNQGKVVAMFPTFEQALRYVDQ